MYSCFVLLLVTLCGRPGETLNMTSTEMSTSGSQIVFIHRDAIFPDFSGIPDFHKSKLSMKKL